MDKMEILNFLLDHYEVAFLYIFKYLSDISKNLSNLKTMVAVHDAEIKNLKEL